MFDSTRKSALGTTSASHARSTSETTSVMSAARIAASGADVVDRRPLRMEDGRLMIGGEEAAGVIFEAASRDDAEAEDDEARLVLVFAAEPVREPRAEAGTADDLMAGVHEDLRGRVIELRSLHRPDDGEIVDVLREVRQQVGHFGAGLAVTRCAT